MPLANPCGVAAVNVQIVLLSWTFPCNTFTGSPTIALTKNPSGISPLRVPIPGYTEGLSTLIVRIPPVSVKDSIRTFAFSIVIFVFNAYPFSPSIMSTLISCGVISALIISLVFVLGLISLLAVIVSAKKLPLIFSSVSS